MSRNVSSMLVNPGLACSTIPPHCPQKKPANFTSMIAKVNQQSLCYIQASCVEVWQPACSSLNSLNFQLTTLPALQQVL
jgi:hypothetical protein